MTETIILEVPTWFAEMFMWGFIAWAALTSVSAVLGIMTARLQRKIAKIEQEIAEMSND